MRLNLEVTHIQKFRNNLEKTDFSIYPCFAFIFVFYLSDPLKCSSYFLPAAPIKNALFERMQCVQNLVQ